jgi:hypothetical protein
MFMVFLEARIREQGTEKEKKGYSSVKSKIAL